MTVALECDATGGPVVYAGRFEEVKAEEFPGVEVLNRWQVLPRQLAPILKDASSLTILDPLSFPFEAITDEQWDIPILATLPPSLDFEALTTVFGSALFERLGPFDRVAIPDPDLWNGLRRRYSWACSQRVGVEPGDPAQVAKQILGSLEDSPHSLRAAKTVYRAELRALAPRFEALWKGRPQGNRPGVLEVGGETGHQACGLDLSRVRFSGIYDRKATVEAARRDFPEQNFGRLDESPRLPHGDGTFNASFCVNFLRSRPVTTKRTLVSEMWRVTHPDGRLLFLEDFVSGERGGEDFPISVPEFLELVLDAAAGPVELDDMESLLYPGEDMFRGALLSFSRRG